MRLGRCMMGEVFRVSVWLLVAVSLIAAAHGRADKPRRKKGEKNENNRVDGAHPPPPSKDASQLELYQYLFSMKRREQIETAEKVMIHPDFSTKYKTVSKLVEVLFPTIQEAMVNIGKDGYTAGMPFPEDRALQEELGKVYENVILFGDFLLRMPDITTKVYNGHKEWISILRWALKFCIESPSVFSGPHAMQLELMKQELGIGPRDPNYINPFKDREMEMGRAKEAMHKKQMKMRREALEEKLKRQKGPKLRRGRHNEL